MITKKDYCDYDTCVALKELGYVGTSRYYYTQRDYKFHFDAYNKFYTVRTANAMGYVLAVHLYDAQKWLREEKNIDVLPRRGYKKRRSYQVAIYINYNRSIVVLDNDGEDYDSPEEALSEGIKETVKILKENETIHE